MLTPDISSCIIAFRYGQAKPLPQKMGYFQGQGVRKVATFIFKYRSMGTLPPLFVSSR